MRSLLALLRRHTGWGWLLGAIFFLYGLPGTIDDGLAWWKWIGPDSAHVSNALVVIGVLVMVSTGAIVFGQRRTHAPITPEGEGERILRKQAEREVEAYEEMKRDRVAGVPPRERVAAGRVSTEQEEHIAAVRRRLDQQKLDRIDQNADHDYWRGQLVELAYDRLRELEFYEDFEIDGQARDAVRSYARTARGKVKSKFRFLLPRLVYEDEEVRILSEGSRAELIALMRSYARLFDAVP